LRLFREEHAEMVPLDLQAFMELSPWLPLPLLWLLAQLWEPTALRVVMRHSKVKPWAEHAAIMANVSEAPGCKGPPKLSANDLIEIMADAAEEMSTHHQQDGVGRWHLEILKIQGAIRFFGMVAVGQRLGVLVKAEEQESAPKKRRKSEGPSRITLGLQGATFMVVRTTTHQAQDLVKHAGQRWFHPQLQTLRSGNGDGLEAMRATMTVLDDLHAKLNGWAGAGGTYLAPHINRKFIMLLSTHFKFLDDIQDPAAWPRSSEALASMEHGAPDAKRHLDQQLPTFASGRNAWPILVGLGCPPLSVTLWLCFYGYAVKQHVGLLPWLEDADKSSGSHFYNTPSSALHLEIL